MSSAEAGRQPPDLDGLAERLLAAADAAALAPLPSAAAGGLSLEQAFETGARIAERRRARGEEPVGWKIGFTNRGIWPRYGVHRPIWAPVWRGGMQLLDGREARLSLRGLSQPRIEPEIVFGLATAPEPGMDEAALRGCIAWVAHGIEVVQTHFADWRFAAADTVADQALHGRLVVGPRVAMGASSASGPGWGDPQRLGEELAALRLRLFEGERLVDEGTGANVLDGPLSALRHWVDAMPLLSPRWRVRAGDLVTTGTITDAWPLAAGQRWRTEPSDERLAGLVLEVVD